MENKIKEKVKKIVKYISKEIKPRRIILFGSRAKEENRYSSDIDLAVDIKNEIDHRTKRKIKEEIDKIAGIYSVDIVYFSDIDEDFKNLINSTGIVIYEKRRGWFVDKKIKKSS
jgi:predicted nucleotidyltransferase